MSAPLIIDPTAGSLTAELKEVFREFEEVTSMRNEDPSTGEGWQYPQAFSQVRIIKKENLQQKRLFHKTTNAGKCEKNGIGYSIMCDTCLRAGRVRNYEGETGKN